MKVTFMIHDLNLFQVSFEQFEILAEKGLETFILAVNAAMRDPLSKLEDREGAQ